MSEVLTENITTSPPPPTLPNDSAPQPEAQELCSSPAPRIGAGSSPGLGGSSLQRVAKVYASTAEAIAHFKPTPREVISGIAPHVFDERKRRRSQQRVHKPYWYTPNGQKRSSPLRGATIISWDEHSIYLEQPDTQPDSDEKAVHDATGTQDARGEEKPGEQITIASQHALIQKRATKVHKSGWRYFRVDIHLLKTVVEKLKFSNSQNSSAARN